MFDGFVPLDAFLRPAPRELPPQPPPSAPDPISEDLETALSAARRFRASLGDALDAALPMLLEAIAREVLARELRLEPAVITKIVTAALDRAAGEHVVAIRLHPSDRDAVASVGLPIVEDGELSAGECRIELRSGTIDSTLRARLETVLAAFAR